MQPKKAMLALLLFLALLPGGPAGAEGPVRSAAAPAAAAYSLGVVPFYGPEKIWALYSPFVDYLNRTTGYSWELKLYHNHDSIIADICSGRLSIAFLGPSPLGKARTKCGVEPLVVALGADGKPFYRSIMLTSDPSVRSLSDLKGKSVAFFRSSTASHVLPFKMLRDAGLRTDDIRPVFFESQPSIMDALQRGEVSAGGVKEALFARFKKSRLRVLKSSEPLPNFAFSALPSIDAGVKKAFIRALLALSPRTSRKDREMMRAWDDEIRSGFIRPSRTHLRGVELVNRYYEEMAHENR